MKKKSNKKVYLNFNQEIGYKPIAPVKYTDFFYF